MAIRSESGEFDPEMAGNPERRAQLRRGIEARSSSSGRHFPSPTPAQMLALGWSILPLNRNKKPFIKWEYLQHQQPTPAEIAEWESDRAFRGWGTVTGKISREIVLDYDGQEGVETMHKLKQSPDRQTPSGGYHVRVEHPGGYIKTLNAKSDSELRRRFPGMDVRGDGGYAMYSGEAIIKGSTPPKCGPYVWLRDPTEPPVPFESLSGELQEFLRDVPVPAPSVKPPKPNGYDRQARLDSERLIRNALAMVAGGHGRNDTGAWLACQLRDNGYSESEALAVNWAAYCPATNAHGVAEPYTAAEWAATVDSVFSRPPREPWGSTRTNRAAARWVPEAETETAPQQVHDWCGGQFELSERGVEYTPAPDKDGNPKPAIWLCSRLEILAQTRDRQSSAWGLLLEWCDKDGEVHRRALPVELLRRDGGAEALCLLASEGLTISAAKPVKELLPTYLQVWPSDRRARCVDRPGWAPAGGRMVYVLDTEAIGEADELIVYQNTHSVTPAFSQLGTVEEWKQNVAAPAAGNSRLVFGISCAFTGPLLDVVGEPSGGFSFCGISSIGKSTTLESAASVWGDPEKYRRTWRSTLNGLEGLGVISNDNVLILDELAAVEGRDAGSAAYLLANGMGKSRAARNGMARPIAYWRLVFLSGGETSLAQHMQTAGLKPTAGQELRMAEIEADAGAGMGMLEELHGKETPLALIEALREATRKYYGAVGYEYLRLLVKDRAASTALAESLTTELREFLTEFASAGSGPQVKRVARRFALVALAGELVSKYGLTGWNKGEAKKAAGLCFISWMDRFGCTGNREERQLLQQVRMFFEANGASRFENMDGDDGQRIINRCGFYRVVETELRPSGEVVPKKGGLREYLVLSEAFRQEVCAGFEFNFAVKVLKKHGCLVPGTDRTAQSVTLPGIGKARVYVINASLWKDKE